MEELVSIKREQVVCDSLQVAEKFGKRHTHVVRAIEDIKKNSSAQKWAQSFYLSRYKDSSGKRNKKYYMNRTGFSILVMGFNGKKALDWKWKFMEAFDQMESIAREKVTISWQETRQIGKLTRRSETDTIKQLVEYAKAQGSQHADKLYMIYSKLANKYAGIASRDLATVMQLNQLAMIEGIISNVIIAGMAASNHYKVIYQDCKTRLQMLAEVAYLEVA